MNQVCEQEVHCPQSKDSKGIRGEHDEWLIGDREDSWDRVDCEDDVGELDECQNQ